MLMGDFFMGNNEPLMFIHSVSKTKNDSGQSVYDSRKDGLNNIKEDKESKVIELNNIREIQKIQNMIKLYNNNKVVVCRILTNEGEVECVPIKIEETKVLVKKTDLSTNNISLNDIKKVEIIHI